MPNGCGKCWQEFKGWLKAFTPLETLLTILEAILLVLLIVFIVFLILHFLSCPFHDEHHSTPQFPSPTPNSTIGPTPTETVKVTNRTTRPTCTYTPNTTTESSGRTDSASAGDKASSSFDSATESVNSPTVSSGYDGATGSVESTVSSSFDGASPELYPDGLWPSLTDGEVASDDDKQLVVALVKVKPSGLTFGCILTVVAERWTITAASCLDSIEEVDSLDNFVIIDNYDELNKGRSHAVSDVRVHPKYEGGNRSFDLALLKSEELGRAPARLPSLLDYFRLTVGGAGRILGFGPFRTIDHSVAQTVHSATVYVLPSKHCTPPRFEERHLVPLSPVQHGRCGATPLCCGVLSLRGTPCNYCAGAPLLRGRVLLGVMADNEQCGAACEPALLANIAAEASWLAHVLAS